MSEMTERIMARFDWSSTPPTAAVVETVAVAVDREPADLAMLYRSIDPDGLDQLFQSEQAQKSALQVAFPFGGTQVVVHGDGRVIVDPVP